PRVKPFARSVQKSALRALDGESDLLRDAARGLVADDRAPVDALQCQLLEPQAAQALRGGGRPPPAASPRRAEVPQLGLAGRAERELDRAAVAVLVVGQDVEDRLAPVPRAAGALQPAFGVLAPVRA